MRLVVIGTAEDGHSTVISDGVPVYTVAAASGASPTVLTGPPAMEVHGGQAVAHQLWPLTARPPTDPFTVPTRARPDYETPTRVVRWVISELGPHFEVSMHTTATLDFGIVVKGSVRLGLDTDDVHLLAGDCVMIHGAAHSWSSGPHGCVIATVVATNAQHPDAPAEGPPRISAP
jgi:quercetin dioxygenase-like cupin family protein